MKNIIITCVLLLGIIGNTFAQKIDTEKLDKFFDLLEDNDKFMGSVALTQKGEIIYSRTTGFEDVELNKKTTIDSKYRIGSISKTFTSVLIQKAVEDNKIDLSQTIDQYFPKVKNADKIKISHLLKHRSGIFSITDRSDLEEWTYQSTTRKDLLSKIEEGESLFEPDSKAEYSNSNFLLLTFILEDVYKKSYSDILNKYIVKPLKLKHTYLGSKTNIENDECYSYVFEEAWQKEKETDMSVPLGAGAIVSNPSDLSIFAKGLFDGKIINKKSLERMIEIEDEFGMGIFRQEFGPNIGYGHTGAIDGFRSFMSYIPKDEVCIALITNGLNYDQERVLMTVLGSFYGRPFKLPNFDVYEVTSEELDQYLGVYTNEKIPFRITISKKENTLYGQVNDQKPLELEASAQHKFRQDRENVQLEFIPSEKAMILYEGGEVIKFTIK